MFDKEGGSMHGDAEDNCKGNWGGDRVVEDGIGKLKVKHVELYALPKPPLPPPHQATPPLPALRLCLLRAVPIRISTPPTPTNSHPPSHCVALLLPRLAEMLIKAQLIQCNMRVTLALFLKLPTLILPR